MVSFKRTAKTCEKNVKPFGTYQRTSLPMIINYQWNGMERKQSVMNAPKNLDDKVDLVFPTSVKPVNIQVTDVLMNGYELRVCRIKFIIDDNVND